jgi:cytochrome c oxidase subunit II
MSKRAIPVVLALSALVMLSACNGTVTQEDNGLTDVSSSAPVAPDETADARVIQMSATNWAFSPASITVKKGEKVVLRITGGEGRHGLAVPGLGLNVAIDSGETKDIVLPTDTAGTFAFFCSSPCGSGHRDMKGEIVIS